MNPSGFLFAALRRVGLLALVSLGLAANVGSDGGGGTKNAGCGVHQFLEIRLAGQPLQDGSNINMILAIEASNEPIKSSAHPVEPELIGPASWERFDGSANAWVSVANGPPNHQIEGLVFSRDHGAQYRATVGLKCDLSNRSQVSMTLTSPAITLQVLAGATAWVDATIPADATVPQGGSARFAALAHGDNTYQWQVSNDHGTSWLDLAGAAADTLQVVAHEDGLQYRLRATNRATGQSIVSRAATLTVTPVIAAPAIAQQPVDATVAVGDPALFVVAATGGALQYQWQRAEAGNPFADLPGATGSAYTLVAQATDNGARLRVRVSNSAGSVTSAEALLTVSQPGQAAITQQPASQTVADGSNAGFTVQATGPSLSYQWQRSDDNGASYADIAGATSAGYSLRADAAAHDDGARFRVLVANAVNTVTSAEALLSVTLLPAAITQAPTDLTVAAGATASFSVAATGSLLRYQWQNCAANGSFTDITGATADTYAFGTQLADNGRRLRVTVGGGTSSSVSSACVTLAVNGSGLSITATPAALTLTEGRTATVNVHIHPISGQSGTVGLAARALPAVTPAALSFAPGLPQSYATGGSTDIDQVLTLTAGPFRTPFTFQLDASEGTTTVSAPVKVTPLPAATASLQLGNSGVETSTSAIERLGPEVLPPTNPPTYAYRGRVDVARGELGLYLKARALNSMYLDFQPTALWLYNDSASPVTLPAGALRMRITGSYTLPAQATAVADAQMQLLISSTTTPVFTASLLGGIRHSNGPSGAAPVITSTSNNPLISAPTVNISTAERSMLVAEIASPALTLAPGANLRVAARLRGYDPVTAGATIDFLTVPVRLCLSLPAGVRLIDNSLSPLNWNCP